MIPKVPVQVFSRVNWLFERRSRLWNHWSFHHSPNFPCWNRCLTNWYFVGDPLNKSSSIRWFLIASKFNHKTLTTIESVQHFIWKYRTNLQQGCQSSINWKNGNPSRYTKNRSSYLYLFPYSCRADWRSILVWHWTQLLFWPFPFYNFNIH